jgi:uncharacterized membrane protein
MHLTFVSVHVIVHFYYCNSFCSSCYVIYALKFVILKFKKSYLSSLLVVWDVTLCRQRKSVYVITFLFVFGRFSVTILFWTPDLLTEVFPGSPL